MWCFSVIIVINISVSLAALDGDFNDIHNEVNRRCHRRNGIVTCETNESRGMPSYNVNNIITKEYSNQPNTRFSSFGVISKNRAYTPYNGYGVNNNNRANTPYDGYGVNNNNRANIPYNSYGVNNINRDDAPFYSYDDMINNEDNTPLNNYNVKSNGQDDTLYNNYDETNVNQNNTSYNNYNVKSNNQDIPRNDYDVKNNNQVDTISNYYDKTNDNETNNYNVKSNNQDDTISNNYNITNNIRGRTLSNNYNKIYYQDGIINQNKSNAADNGTKLIYDIYTRLSEADLDKNNSMYNNTDRSEHVTNQTRTLGNTTSDFPENTTESVNTVGSVNSATGTLLLAGVLSGIILLFICIGIVVFVIKKNKKKHLTHVYDNNAVEDELEIRYTSTSHIYETIPESLDPVNRPAVDNSTFGARNTSQRLLRPLPDLLRENGGQQHFYETPYVLNFAVHQPGMHYNLV